MLTFVFLLFYFLVETEPDAPRSETIVAGLGSFLATRILQPETMTTVIGRSIQLYG